jgi:cell division protein FtsQ
VKARRRRRSPVARIRPFWMPIALGIGVALVLLVVAATWPGFDPKQIAVTGNHRVTRGEILAAAAIAPHVNIWLQNTGAIANRIEAIPYIGTVRVHRAPPATIRIVVIERTPFAILRSGTAGAVVDRSLRVLEPETAADLLPVFDLEPGLYFPAGAYVRTRTAIELRNSYLTIAAAQIVPRELGFDRFGGLVVTMRGGVRLLLGAENDLGPKLTLADAILSQVVGRQRRVAAIDLRAPAAPVVVYR